MCLLENQLTARLKIIQLTDNSKKTLLDLVANQLQLPLCVTVPSIGSRGVVGQEVPRTPGNGLPTPFSCFVLK